MNKYIRVIKNFCADKTIRFSYLTKLGVFNGLSDEQYLKLKYKNVFGRNLDLENPKTFNEKLQWLKLYNRKPEYTVMVDKYKVREYIAQMIGEEYLIPLLGVWDNPDEIDFDALPNQFVLKCNHNSGTGMCICKDKMCLIYVMFFFISLYQRPYAIISIWGYIFLFGGIEWLKDSTNNIVGET